MPIAQIYIMEGRDDATKEKLIEEITDAMVRSLNAPRDVVRVMLTEMPKQHFGIGGTSAKKLGR